MKKEENKTTKLTAKLTTKEILVLVKYDIEAIVKNPERHIIKYAKQKCKEQKEICSKVYDSNIVFPEDFINAPPPKFE